MTSAADPDLHPARHENRGCPAVPGRPTSALPGDVPEDDQKVPASVTAQPGGVPHHAPRFTRIWRSPAGPRRAAGPVGAADTAGMREWTEARNRAALDLAPVPDNRGISTSRAQNWIRGLGLTARPCVIAGRDALQQYRRDLTAAGYGIPALDRLLDRGDLGAVYSPEVRLVIACRNGEPARYLENVIVHELAHGTENLIQEWTAEQLPGPVPAWNLQILRGGFNVVSVQGTETGALLEEGFAELLAAEYTRDVLGGEGLLPARLVPPHLAAISGHIWQTGPGAWTYSRSAPAAAAVKLLAEARPELRGALIRARTSPRALTDVARIINSIRPGLYREVKTYGHFTFPDGCKHVRSAVRNRAAAAP